MARRKKKLTRTEREQRRRQREEKEVSGLVSDTTGRFTCSVEIAHDFASQCEEPDPHFNLAAGQLAIEFWTGRPSPRAQQILELLGEFTAINGRYLDSLAELARRFEALAGDQTDHEHLEPVEAYQVRVRERLFPDPPEPG